MPSNNNLGPYASINFAAAKVRVAVAPVSEIVMVPNQTQQWQGNAAGAARKEEVVEVQDEFDQVKAARSQRPEQQHQQKRWRDNFAPQCTHSDL